MIHTGFQSHRYNGLSEATTIRPPSSSLLTIDSADRFENQIERREVESWTILEGTPAPRNYSAYDFTITKNESIMNGFFTRLAVTEIVFPWAIPNINGLTRQIFVRIDVSGSPEVDTLITLNAGFYTPAELAATIQAKVRLLPDCGAFTMSYSLAPFTNCFLYQSNDINVDIGFAPLTVATSAINNPEVMQLFDLLGFNDNNLTPTPASVSRPTLCQFTRYVDIVCPQLIYNQGLKDTSSQRTVRDALCRVYLGNADSMTTGTVDPADPDYCPPGCAPAVIHYIYSAPKQIQWTPNQPVPGYLQFVIYDDNGIPLAESGSTVGNNAIPLFSSSTGIDWSMTLLVTEN